MAACDGDAVQRDRAGGVAVVDGQRLLQHALDLSRERGAWTIDLQRSTTAQQVTLQALHFLPQLLDTRLTRCTRRAIEALTHAPVMPESAPRYKSDPVTNYPNS